jgi:membrane protein
MLKIKKSNFFVFFHILTVVIFVSLRKKIFYIFPQAMNVYNFHVDFITLYKYGYIHHIPRYLVVYPSIFLGELFDIDIHLVNTVYSMIIFCITIILWWRIIKKYRVRINLLTWILLVFFSIGIITFVNGRIIFAYFSEALLLYYFVEEKFQINFKFLIIFLFSSVSSGTMSVILIICFLSRKMLNNTARAKKLLRLFKFPIIIMIGYFFLIFLKKNLIYYSGNIFAMLQHGLFAILENLSIEMYVLLLIGLICFIYITILLKKKDELLFKFYIGSVIGVFFGFTAGSMMLPILLVYFLIIFNSKTIKRLEGDKNK